MFKGIFTPMVTVFDKDGNLDFVGNEKVINHLIANGVSGILFFGSMGEFVTLSMKEKKEFINFAIKAVNKRVPVLIGTGGTAVDEVIELTKYAEMEDADAAVIVSPYYYKLDDQCLYRYYAEIASSVDIPIILYNFPDRTAVCLEPELILKLAGKFKNIVGVKDTVDNISHTRKLIRAIKPEFKDFSIFSGFDEYLVSNLMAGGDGVICGLTNIAPKLFVELYNAYNNADFLTVTILQKKVYTLMQIYDVSQPFFSPIKAATAEIVGGIIPMTRKPAEMAGKMEIEKIRNIFKEAKISY